MIYSRLLVPVVALFSTTLAVPAPANLNLPRQADNHTLNRERADAVKAAFEYAWNGYKTYAFPHDELHPISNSYSDSRHAGEFFLRHAPANISAGTAGVLLQLMPSAPHW
jgi:mannosyl-oligosaccharide alpha-1,2-mannosidase